MIQFFFKNEIYRFTYLLFSKKKDSIKLQNKSSCSFKANPKTDLKINSTLIITKHLETNLPKISNYSGKCQGLKKSKVFWKYPP